MTRKIAYETPDPTIANWITLLKQGWNNEEIAHLYHLDHQFVRIVSYLLLKELKSMGEAIQKQ